RQFTGILVRKTPTALVLRTDQDQEVAVPLKDVESQEPSNVSLMPDGLTDTLTRGELLDLVRFLSELGKVGPYAVGPARVARTWQALAPPAEAGAFLRARGLAGAAAGGEALKWEPAYGTVAGSLPLEDVPRLKVSKDLPALSVLRTRLEASSAAKVKLKANATGGLALWLDGEPVTLKAVTELSLKPGVHTLTLAVDRGKRKEALRPE